MSSSKSRVSNVEMALLLAKIKPNSDTRSCTQCTRQVPKAQLLLTYEQCREKEKRKKARRTERKLAVDAGLMPKKSTTANYQAIIDEYEAEEASKVSAKPSSKKKREEWDEIEAEMGENWDSVKARHKAEMAAAKGTSGKKRKAEPYGALYAAGLAHDRAVIAECMAIVNAAHASASNSKTSLPTRRQQVMAPLVKRQKVSEMVPPKLSDIPSSSGFKDPAPLGATEPAKAWTPDKKGPQQPAKPRGKQATLGSYFKPK